VEIENPAFDVTPAKYVTAIVTERGVARAPYTESLKSLSSGQTTTDVEADCIDTENPQGCIQ